MSNPTAPNQITDAVASVIHSVSSHNHTEMSQSSQIWILHRSPRDKTWATIGNFDDKPG